MREPTIALEIVEEILAGAPLDAYAMNAKSCALAANKDFADAVKWQQKASENKDWLKDESPIGGIHAQARIAAWSSGQLWHP